MRWRLYLLVCGLAGACASRPYNPAMPEIWVRDGVGVGRVTIRGTVHHRNGAPIVGARVRISCSGCEAPPRETRSDPLGNFRVRGLAPGEYSVCALAGRDTSFTGLIARAGQRFDVELTLIPERTPSHPPCESEVQQ